MNRRQMKAQRGMGMDGAQEMNKMKRRNKRSMKDMKRAEMVFI